MLLVLESMKMELSIAAPHAGTRRRPRRWRRATASSSHQPLVAVDAPEERVLESAARATSTSRQLEDLEAPCELERVACAAGGGPRATERHVARGKLPVRDRVERLCDPGTAVPRALRRWPPRSSTTATLPGAGIVTGVGIVHGRHS